MRRGGANAPAPTPLRHAPVPTDDVDTGACALGKNASARSMNDVKTMFKRYKTKP